MIGILTVLVIGLVLAVGVAGLVLFIVGLAKHRPALWGTGLGLGVPVLLLVILLAGVAGLRATRAVGTMGTRSQQARITAATTDIANIRVALDAFEVDCGRYPTDEEGLQALVAPPAGLAHWRGPYLQRLPTDAWGSAYVYRCPGRHNPTSYDLYSFGPDRREGGGDDIDNWSGR